MNRPLLTVHERMAQNFASRSGAVLTILLLVIAAGLILLALQPDHKLVKAGVLAWVILP